MGSLSEHVRQTLMTKDIRPSTRRTYEYGLRPFMDMDLDTLTVSDLNEVLLSIPNQNTRRRVVIALKACVDHPAVKALRYPESVPKVYDLPSEETIRLALMTCPHETRGLLMMYCGLRVGEALAISKDNLTGNMLRVTHQKNDAGSLVPVKTTADAIPVPDFLVPLVAVLEPSTVSVKAVRKAMLNAGKRVGIHLNPHMLRHWYATTLINNKVPPHLVQRLMRHKNIRVTLGVYAQVGRGDLYGVVKDLGAF